MRCPAYFLMTVTYWRLKSSRLSLYLSVQVVCLEQYPSFTDFILFSCVFSQLYSVSTPSRKPKQSKRQSLLLDYLLVILN